MRRLISEIVIGDRFRRDLGDLTSLAASMSKGLINPVTVNASGHLIAGHRRVEAAKLLGWNSIDVREIDTLGDAVRSIELERDENTERLPMTPSELTALAMRLARLHEDAAKRAQSHGATAPGRSVNAFSGAGESVQPIEVAAEVAKVIGYGKTTTYDILAIGRAAESQDPATAAAGGAALEELDSGAGVQPTAAKLRRTLGVAPQSRKPAAKDVQILDEFADRMNGLALFTKDLSRRLADSEIEQESEKVREWITDLSAARSGIDSLIRYLRKQATK